ncbi:LOW QUALITY PROTEIN: transmembrane protein 200C [Spinachia spinachia]
MIATGGLLRINTRRQDSLRSKPHKAHTPVRRNQEVVVKGKLKLLSVPGLAAALGILVLLVGVVMAVLGYWPRDGLFFSARPQEATAMASVSSSRSTAAEAQGGEEGDGGGDKGGEGGGDGFNRTGSINGTIGSLPGGFLDDFLHRYLYSDRLKVFGPLIMGIGIFLFICANAALHENRNKKMKVINLRDMYSTVIDLHGLRRDTSSFSSNPLNGLVNYVQSKSLEAKPRPYPASLINYREAGGGGGLLSRLPMPGSSAAAAGGGGGGGDAVFTISEEALPRPTSLCHRLSLPLSFSSPHLVPQKEVLNSFTLTLRRPSSTAQRQQGEEEAASQPPPLCSSRAFQGSCSSPSLHREVLLIHSSCALTPSSCPTSSLSQRLSFSSSTPDPHCRRRSLPTGQSKLTH